MGKYRKKPVVIEAVQIRGGYTKEIKEFLGDFPHEWDGSLGLKIATLEGVMVGSQFDWIIKEPFATEDRRFYPCKPDIFDATYEAVE